MILTQLYEYADQRMTLPPARYNTRYAAWLISLTEEGQFEGCICLKGTKKSEKKGKEFEAPDRKRAGKTIRPKLLFDTFEYVLGIGRPDVAAEKVAEYHSQFKALVQDCANETDEPTVKAVASFLASWEPSRDRILLPKDINPSENVTFRVGDIFPADAKSGLTQVQEFWMKSLSSNDSDEGNSLVSSPRMQCLVTQEIAPIAKRMPISIKGLGAIGGNPTGTELVSANQKPFTSYGLENSLSSPISIGAAERFAKAINHLIADQRHRTYIGSKVAYIWWTREETGFNPLNFLNQPKVEEVESLLKSPFSGQQASGLDDVKVNQFYALALTANNARAVVRDWLETTVPNVRANLQQWFQAQQMVDLYGASPRPLGVYTLAASVYRDATKEMQPTAPTALIRNALHGDRIPEDMLVKLVRRNHTEQEITYPRAVLLKLIFSSNPNRREMMQNMEKLNPDPNLQGLDLEAYACGRLLAVLESIQKAALGSVNASLTDRYYGSASSTPAVAFPPLLRGARAHLSKLRKAKTGAYKALEERLEEVMVILPTFPKTLGLQQQGLFGLGYYHQRASDRAAAKAKSEANKAEKTTADS
jgi:CRISPR-associated protein Csd1